MKRSKDLMNLLMTLPRSLALSLILTLASPATAPAKPFQVNGKPIPDKVALDVEYLNRQSFWFDMKILWMTFLKVINRDGVSH